MNPRLRFQLVLKVVPLTPETGVAYCGHPAGGNLAQRNIGIFRFWKGFQGVRRPRASHILSFVFHVPGLIDNRGCRSYIPLVTDQTKYGRDSEDANLKQRVYLKKLEEEQNEELIQEICRRCDYSRYDVKNRFVVYFSIENILPLIGSQEGR